jgi:acetylornithine deacetylase/succinyl-diaminopimelate desuccinylase-like protein
MDAKEISSFVDAAWEKSLLPEIERYIRIPAKSPMFDAAWEKNGHIEAAVKLLEAWALAENVKGMKLEVVRLPGRTPLLFMDIPGDVDDTVMLYGHYDKQPEMVGWAEGLGPWTPVRQGDKLFGRGGADDGYSTFASLLAIKAVRQMGGKHARCVVLIEGCEESGSFDLPHYVEHLKPRIGKPSLIICLDSGAGNYDQLWLTSSLRGLVGGTLTVEVLTEGIHSGDASGVVPSSFRIARSLLDRVEDSRDGRILVESFYGSIPEERRTQAEVSGRVLGESLFKRFPYAGSTRAMSEDVTELVLNRTWRPYLSVTGADGLPAIANAGNVLRPRTSLKLSLRLPPNVKSGPAAAELRRILEASPPHGATVRFEAEEPADGWDAPPTSPWLAESLARASEAYFGREVCHMGEGGSIPFMGMLGREFPEAQFVITGVLGPQSNAHGPNEFLHVPTGKRITSCMAQVLDDHARRAR